MCRHLRVSVSTLILDLGFRSSFRRMLCLGSGFCCGVCKRLSGCGLRILIQGLRGFRGFSCYIPVVLGVPLCEQLKNSLHEELLGVPLRPLRFT